MIVGPSGHVNDSQNQLFFNFGDTEWSQIILINSRNNFYKYYVGKSQSRGSPTSCKCTKRRGPKNPEAPSNKFLKILNVGKRSTQKHDVEV